MTHNSGSLSQSTGVDGVVETGVRPYLPMRLNPWLAMIVAIAWSTVGFFLMIVLEMALDIKIPKLVSSIVNLFVGFFGVFYVLPVVNHVPFGPVPLKEYARRIGFYLPPGAWRHVLLGVVLGVCNLLGMLVASILTGRYVLDWSTINLSHLVFSLNPGIFEEIFFRGILVILLLRVTRSLWKSMLIQIIIFGLMHFKGADLISFVEVFSVMIIAIGFTYAAYKTRALLAGMVFHFLHDAFLYFVQVPEGTFIGLRENVIFYACLWSMVGLGCLIIWFAAERLHVRADRELYVVAPVSPQPDAQKLQTSAP